MYDDMYNELEKASLPKPPLHAVKNIFSAIRFDSDGLAECVNTGSAISTALSFLLSTFAILGVFVLAEFLRYLPMGIIFSAVPIASVSFLDFFAIGILLKFVLALIFLWTTYAFILYGLLKAEKVAVVWWAHIILFSLLFALVIFVPVAYLFLTFYMLSFRMWTLVASILILLAGGLWILVASYKGIIIIHNCKKTKAMLAVLGSGAAVVLLAWILFKFVMFGGYLL